MQPIVSANSHSPFISLQVGAETAEKTPVSDSRDRSVSYISEEQLLELKEELRTTQEKQRLMRLYYTIAGVLVIASAFIIAFGDENPSRPVLAGRTMVAVLGAGIILPGVHAASRSCGSWVLRCLGRN